MDVLQAEVLRQCHYVFVRRVAFGLWDNFCLAMAINCLSTMSWLVLEVGVHCSAEAWAGLSN